MTTPIRIYALLFGMLALAFCMRIAWISGEQLSIAEHALQQSKPHTAILAYERSIHAYLPLLPSRSSAISGLTELNRHLESSHELILALEGWRRMRGALLSSRSIFGQPNKELLSEANSNIARLAALTDTQKRMSKQEIQQEDLRLLNAHPKDISSFWALMQFLFLCVWILATAWLIWSWNNFETSSRMKFAFISVSGLLLWLASLYLAG